MLSDYLNKLSDDLTTSQIQKLADHASTQRKQA